MDNRFNWKNRINEECVEDRTHTTKHFPSENKIIQSLGLLHYFDGEKFEEISELKFPEGIEINQEKTHVLDLPEWGRAEIGEDGCVRIYDKKDVSIYIFKNLITVPKGKEPYREIDGKKVNQDYAEKAKFVVENNKLFIEVEEGNQFPLQAYDDTDTNSTNNKDSFMASNAATTNYGSETYMQVWYHQPTGSSRRGIIHFTLSAGAGSISKVELFLYEYDVEGGATLDIHEVTQTAWVEDEVTWNVYSTGNSWSSAGGDYDGTIIDSCETGAGTGWKSWVLMGTGATNPLSLDWSDDVHLLIKEEDEAGATAGGTFYTKENGSNVPYLQITYTPVSASLSPSVSPSISSSLSPSISASLSASLSPSISSSVSPSASLSPSISQSLSPSLSPSISSSVSPSASLSSSLSLSLSASLSPSISSSVSPSASLSPSLSLSLSPSISPSISSSVSPSGSLSPSLSQSLSQSLSPSISSSVSPSSSISSSISPSPSPGWEDYTRGDYAVLPANDDNLETAYSVQDYTDVATKDDVRVSQTATDEYAIHQFKNYVAANMCGLEWEGQTNISPQTSTVYLQIYNRNTTTWDTVDSDNTSNADTDFILESEVADLTNYKNASGVISCRVYQEAK